MKKWLLKTMIVSFLVLVSSSALYASNFSNTLPNRVKLNVPIINQKLSGMCGPACLSMIFKYYGASNADQYSIAEKIVKRFPNEPRVVKSGISRSSSIDFKKYPGTGTKMMRKFLKDYGDTENIRLRELPADEEEAKRKEGELYFKILSSVANKTPVIVHQYWKGRNSRGHYRIVTGFDLENKTIFLNDPRIGPITQTVSEFLSKWNVQERWLHYNAMIFNTSHAQLIF